MYKHFINYLKKNELYELAEEVEINENTKYTLLFIEDHLEDIEIVKTLNASVIKDMILYQLNHK